MGWFLDSFVLYVFKTLVYVFKSLARVLHLRGSATWSKATAKVASSKSAPGGYGCPIAEVVYTYEIDGSIYSGLNEKPFISSDSVEEYATRFTPGSTMVVRLKPGEPEKSIVRDADSDPK